MRKGIKSNILLVLLIALTLGACSSTQSLQEYYVDNAENPNFISLDVPASILKLDDSGLSEEQREALGSLRKLNILAFKKTTANGDDFKAEKAKVNTILKNESFNELMKLNSSYGKGVIKYLGDDDAIDEVIIYGSSKEKGFALIRVLGKNMNPAHLAQLLQVIQSADFNTSQLGELGEFLKG